MLSLYKGIKFVCRNRKRKTFPEKWYNLFVLNPEAFEDRKAKYAKCTGQVNLPAGTNIACLMQKGKVAAVHCGGCNNKAYFLSSDNVAT